MPGIKEVPQSKAASIQMRTNTISKTLLATSFSVVLASLCQSADAQYWGGYGWGLGSSLLYPLTYLPFRLLSGSAYRYGYGNSGYALNNLMYQTSNAPYGYLPYGGKFGFNNSNDQAYWNSQQSGYGQGTQGQAQPYNYNPNAYNHSYYQPRWQNQPVQQQAPPQQQAAPADNSMFEPAHAATPTGSVGVPTVLGELPPTAPERYSGPAPFAEGFIQAVNNKYDGDIGRALKDREIKSWAQALNLVSRQKSSHPKLSSSRKDAIEKIMKDESLDPQSKLDAVKILLK